MTPPLVLVDPPRRPFWPLAATRPAADLLAGCFAFHDRWARREGAPAALVRDPEVAGAAAREGPPPPPSTLPAPEAGWRVALVTWVPPAGWAFGDEPVEHRAGDLAVAWRLGPEAARAVHADAGTGDPATVRSALAALDLPPSPAGGTMVDSAWGLVEANGRLLAADAALFEGGASLRGVDPLVLLGEAADLRVGEGVQVGPYALLDARDGPIVLDAGARVEAHAALRGPVYVGPGTVVLGGSIGDGTSIGPRCRVRGEVERSVFRGFVNKAHDGFVGHSALGSWTNLGAGTITSDLKNTYGTVRVEDGSGVVDTGLLKVGGFLGDHVKTGIGTLLATGCRIGPGSHVFGGRSIVPRYLPAFSWYDGRERVPVRWDAFESAARTAMARRGQELEAGERGILAALHAATAG